MFYDFTRFFVLSSKKIFAGSRNDYIQKKIVYNKIDETYKGMNVLEKAFLVSTGTELLLGSTIDTNSVFIAERLNLIGIKVIGKIVVGDNEQQIEEAFKIGLKVADVIISSGGLGPTQDDLTKEIACRVMGSSMVLVEEEAEKIRDFFQRRHRSMPDNNLKQAMFPLEAEILPNPQGTAPGMYLIKNNQVVICLPGPPREMQPMFRQEVEPRLKKQYDLKWEKAASRVIKVIGPGESQVEVMLADIMGDLQGCSMALLAKGGEIHIRITAEGKDYEHSRQILEDVCRRIEEKMGNTVFGWDEDTLSGRVAELLKKGRKSLAVAESCTGGLVGKMITDLPGSSNYFWGGVISYSNQAKATCLGVKDDTLAVYGAVSAETAIEMAEGVRKLAGTNLGVAITGIAGPEGGSKEKPVGLVYIAIADEKSSRFKEVRFVGSREAIRLLSAKSALDWVRKWLIRGENI